MTRLTEDFAQWMLTDLGYRAVEMRFPVGDHGGRSRFVDVRGETYRLAWHRAKRISLGVLCIAVVIRLVFPPPEGQTPVLATALVYAGILGLVVALLGQRRTRRYAWVDCKERRRPVVQEDIVKVHKAVEQLRKASEARWRAGQVLVVADTYDFDTDAIELARSMGIECHRRARTGFERAD